MSLKTRLRTWRRTVHKRTARRPNFFFNPLDLSGLDIMCDGQWERHLIARIRYLINEGDESILFVDIGANIGLTRVPICNDVTKLMAIGTNPVSTLILQAN